MLSWYDDMPYVPSMVKFGYVLDCCIEDYICLIVDALSCTGNFSTITQNDLQFVVEHFVLQPSYVGAIFTHFLNEN